MAGEGLRITAETLVRCGLPPGKGAEHLELGKGSGVLNESIEFEIVIENQPNPYKNNELQSRVRWVNDVGGGLFRERKNPTETAAMFSGLARELLIARQKIHRPQAAKPNTQLPSHGTQEEIGF